MIEKWNECRRSICIEFIDSEKAFDSTEDEAIFRAVGINETFITIVEDIYTGTTARVHTDNQVRLPMPRGVRQGDPIPPTLFTATIQKVSENTQQEETGINIDGEKLSDL